MRFGINQKLTEIRAWIGNRFSRQNTPIPTTQPTPNAPTTINPGSLLLLQKLMIDGNHLASVVRSRVEDRQNQWSEIAARNDAKRLNQVYQIVKGLSYDPTLRNINNAITREGFNNFTFEFSAAIASEDARQRAKLATEFCKPLARLMIGDQLQQADRFLYEQDRPVTLADLSGTLGIFCNVPCHLEYRGSDIVNFRPLEPFGWQINSNELMRFDDINRAYLKWDFVTKQPEKAYPASNLVWVSANQSISERYGTPICYELAQQIAAMQQLYGIIKDARLAYQPKTYVFAEGQNGYLSMDEMKRLLSLTPEEILKNGGYIGPFSNALNQVIPGKGDVKTVSAQSGYFADFGDVEIFQQAIASSYSTHLGLYFNTEKANRNTLDLLMILKQQTKRAWGANLTLTAIIPAFCRQLVAKGLDTKDLICQVHYEDSQTLEEKKTDLEILTTLYDKGLLSQDQAHIMGCKLANVDPHIDAINRETRKPRSVNELDKLFSSVNKLDRLAGLIDNANSALDRIDQTMRNLDSERIC